MGMPRLGIIPDGFDGFPSRAYDSLTINANNNGTEQRMGKTHAMLSNTDQKGTGLRDFWRRLWRMLPAVLAFSLLSIQIAIPWTVPHFVTQDGPSHLYTAVVAKKLLFHQQPYASLYRINRRVIPNWGGTILFALSAAIAGVGHAEQVVIGVILCLGFFSFSYAIRSLSPKASRWTPLSNFLLQTRFLWIGFYNFYLGMVLLPLAIGFYARRNGKLTIRAAAVLAFGLVLLFFVHLTAAAVSVLALAVIAIWLHIIRPALCDHSFDLRASARQAGILMAAMAPAIALTLVYARSESGGDPYQPNVLQSWLDFPMLVFTTADGLAGGQSYLWPAVLGLMIIAVLGMRSSEWRTAKGGLAIVAIAVFLIYLFVPDSGLGGNDVKVRFSWTVFIVGCLLVSSVARLQPLRTPLAVFLSACLAFNLTSTTQRMAAYSKAVEDYLSTLTSIRPGSTVVRFRYTTPDLPERYAYNAIGRDPLLHLDSYASARVDCIVLCDYQAPTTLFPIIFKSKLDHDQQFTLLEFEHPGDDASAKLDRLRRDLPLPIDYVIIVADQSTPADSGLSKVMASLDLGMQLIAQSPAPPFVRVYQRKGPR